MKRVARTVAAVTAAMAIAVPSALAVPATASATARQCLDHLASNVFFASDGGQRPAVRILSPGRLGLLAVARARSDHICAGAVMSMAISRAYTSQDVRNVNARRVGNDFHAQWAMRWTDTGNWQLRQFAVAKDRQLAIVGFDAAAPAFVTIKRASVLTGRDRDQGDGRAVDLVGYLRAYSSTGTLVPMAAGRRVQLQIRPHGYPSEPYRTFEYTHTSPSGFWGIISVLPRGRYDVRVAFVSPYQTIASDFTFIGVAG